MAEILRLAREQLTTSGPAALSLRAIARDLGMVSSALYRYVASRDELLTLLIVEAYDDLGDVVDAAVEAAGTRPRARVQALAGAVRDWAVREPARFGLLYGTPVPGYHAPGEQTVPPGTRVALRLAAICEDAHRAGDLAAAPERLPQQVRRDLDALRREYGWTLPAPAVARAITVWAALTGAVSFDVFDQYGTGTFGDRDGFVRHQVDLLADLLGLPR